MVNWPRRGLGVLPAQKHPNRVEPGAGDTAEVAPRSRSVVLGKPCHRRGRGPVVDTEPERRPGGALSRRCTPFERVEIATYLLSAIGIDHWRATESGDRLRGCATGALEPRHAANGSERPRHASDQEAGRAVVDQLGHRPAPRRDHRRPAGHRSTTLKPKGSSKLTRCSSGAPRRAGLRAPRRRPGRDSAPGRRRCAARRSRSSRWSWTMPAMTSGMPTRPATSIASTGPLSGWIRPKNSR